MIIKLKNSTTESQKQQLVNWAENQGVSVCTVIGNVDTLLGFIGDTSHIDIEQLEAMEIVDAVKRIQAPYKKANRSFHPEDTVITVGDVQIGSGKPVIIAGPCSVESEEQICNIAKEVKKAGAQILRGGAFKPRTSPYAFQGLRKDGITLLLEAKKETGLPIVTEIMDISQLSLFDDIDMIQVGARNMQNFELLKELGKINKPILLKRGLSSTLEELLMSAEYIMSGGNEQVILCERGIRTFERATRNTLDLSAVPVLKSLSHLPVIVDPSHATGKANLVAPMSRAAIAAGADGLIIEVHNNPEMALCDGQQSLTPAAFAELKQSLDKVAAALC
ncbi:3-deoxy-7-phosphoheptulonate synthase [Sporofaciens sp. SGI.106]|uniref:3-deoxy-7-phosphoheptulonate synthase n=1 Tax=Sporofaciens sp. SGI.106 TaxID=3420568 RepID=UPI002A9AB577|nr:3-deoxy-7-phosphoheptulonate synthase [Lachnoclostridium sp.]